MRDEFSTGILITRWQGGEGSARDALIERLYPELNQIAAARLRHENGSSLSTGDLINEVVVRLIEIERVGLTDRAHLVALASRLMRNILVDHARLKNTDRRRHHKVELNTRIEGEQKFDLNSLNSALIRLGALDQELSDLVEMRYFGGMTLADIGEVTGQSEATVKRRWQVARAWLTDALMNPINHA
jgi:RNA polymerase sigma factor (TIGR02999 family)